MNDIDLTTIPHKFVYMIDPQTSVLWGSGHIAETDYSPDRHVIEPAPPFSPVPGNYDIIWNKQNKTWSCQLNQNGRLAEWEKVKTRRNEMLTATDWTQMPDVPLTPEKKTAVNEYRQALRDITTKFLNPDEVVWPTNPLG